LDKPKPNLKDLVIVSERASELVIPPKLLSRKLYWPK